MSGTGRHELGSVRSIQSHGGEGPAAEGRNGPTVIIGDIRTTLSLMEGHSDRVNQEMEDVNKPTDDFTRRHRFRAAQDPLPTSCSQGPVPENVPHHM